MNRKKTEKYIYIVSTYLSIDWLALSENNLYEASFQFFLNSPPLFLTLSLKCFDDVFKILNE